MKLFTDTGLIVRQQFMNARLCTSLCSYNSACTNIFYSQVQMPRSHWIALKNKSRSSEFLADRTAAHSTVGYHSSSWTSCIYRIYSPSTAFLWSSISSPWMNLNSYLTLNYFYRVSEIIFHVLINRVGVHWGVARNCPSLVRAFAAPD